MALTHPNRLIITLNVAPRDDKTSSLPPLAQLLTQRVAPLFVAFGVRPTYLLSPDALVDVGCRDALAALTDCDRGVLFEPHRLVPKMGDEPPLSPEIERAKIEVLTELFSQQLGHLPTSFRARPNTLSQEIARHLPSLGYSAHSPVTPTGDPLELLVTRGLDGEAIDWLSLADPQATLAALANRTEGVPAEATPPLIILIEAADLLSGTESRLAALERLLAAAQTLELSTCSLADFMGSGETHVAARTARAEHKPRILLIADVPNWIFARHCRMLQLHLGHLFEFTIKTMREPYDEDAFDLIYPLEWNLIPAERFSNPAKYVSGIRSHVSWEAANFDTLIHYLRENYQRIHVVSERLHRIFAPALPAVDYVTHGLDTEFFTPTTLTNQSGKKLRLGWAGNRKTPAKGFEAFIEPLGELPGVELVFCGYSDNNLSQEEVRTFYDSLDAYVCASESEGNNNSLLEAAAMGRAIITTDNGTVPEYLRHEESALIVPRDLASFVSAVEALRDQPELRLRLGRRAKEAVRAGWDWRLKARDYRAFFLQALATLDPIRQPSLTTGKSLNILYHYTGDSAQHLARILTSYLSAFTERDSVALHIVSDQPAENIQGRLVAWLEARGYATEDIPDIELYDQTVDLQTLPTYLRGADLAIGDERSRAIAQTLSVPCFDAQDVNPQWLQVALDFPSLDWTAPAFPTADLRREYWLLPMADSWQAALRYYFSNPIPADQTLALLVPTGGASEAYAKVEDWLITNGIDPEQAPDMEIFETTPASVVPLYRMGLCCLNTGDARSQALAAAIGQPCIFPTAQAIQSLAQRKYALV